MSSFLSKIKVLRKRGRSARAIELINPPREWLIGLLLAAGTFSFGALYLGYDFWEQYHMADNQPIVDESVVRYHQGDAIYYIGEFKKRDTLFQTLRAEVREQAEVPNVVLPVVEEGDETVIEPVILEKPIAP